MTTDRDETDRTPAVCDQIHVDLGERSYEVVIRDGLLDHVGEFLAPFQLGPDTVIVTNPVVKRHYGARVIRSLNAVGLNPTVLALPDGERTKSLKWVLEGSREQQGIGAGAPAQIDVSSGFMLFY